MDLASAYPKTAGITSWQRAVRLDRGQAVCITDRFELKQPVSVFQSLMTPCEVARVKPGTLKLQEPESTVTMLLQYEPSDLVVEIEVIELKDDKLKEMWGDHLQRICLKSPSDVSHAAWTVRIVAAK